jgi:hypothetical protein
MPSPKVRLTFVESAGWSPRTSDALINMPTRMVAVLRTEFLLMLSPLRVA